jgi:hypothetical protein
MNLIFWIIKSNKIPKLNSFFSKKNIVIIFKNLCTDLIKIQKIIPSFIKEYYKNISPTYIIQNFFDCLNFKVNKKRIKLYYSF